VALLHLAAGAMKKAKRDLKFKQVVASCILQGAELHFQLSKASKLGFELQALKEQPIIISKGLGRSSLLLRMNKF